MSLAADSSNLFSLRSRKDDGVNPTVIAPDFSAEVAYPAGRLVMKGDKLYRAKEDVAAGAWNVSAWTEVSIDTVMPVITHGDGESVYNSKTVTATEGGVSVNVKFAKGHAASEDDVEIIAMSKKDLKASNAGKVLAINAEGTGVELTENGETGLLSVAHDTTMTGEGNEESPLSVKTMTGAVGPANTVHIGEHDYNVVRIGTRYWITTNLREVIGNLGTDCRWYDDDADTYEFAKCGLLYKWTAVCSANETNSTGLDAIVPEGWHVPTRAEFDELFTEAGGYYNEEDSGYLGNCAAVLSSQDEWAFGWGGIDTYGFSAIPGGLALPDSSTGELEFNYITTDVMLHSSTTETVDNVVNSTCAYWYDNEDYDSQSIVFTPIYIYNDNNIASGGLMSVRLCCDAEVFERSCAGGSSGLVPAPKVTDAGKVLGANGHWVIPNIPVFSAKTGEANMQVKIGSNMYGVTKIGDTYWLAENLREEVGTLNTDYYWYLENKAAAKMYRMGALYKHATVCDSTGMLPAALKNIVPEGWRLPGKGDFESLFVYAGADVQKLTTARFGDELGGTDDYGFDVFPAGYAMLSGGEVEYGWNPLNSEIYGTAFATATVCTDMQGPFDLGDDTVTQHYTASFACPSGDETWSDMNPTISGLADESAAISVRLCCDASVIEAGGGGIVHVSTAGNDGLVPAPGLNDDGKFLGSDAKWHSIDIPEINEMSGPVSYSLGISVGNNQYGIVKIGDMYWLAGNLKEEIGTYGEDYTYYNDDKEFALNNGYGALYNRDTVCGDSAETTSEAIKALFPEGWHVPTWAELAALKTNAGPTGEKLTATSYGGSDVYGFFATPGGECVYGTRFEYGGRTTRLLGSSTNIYDGEYYYANLTWELPTDGDWSANRSKLSMSYRFKDAMMSVRLCCSASIVEQNIDSYRGTFVYKPGSAGLVPAPSADDIGKVLSSSGEWVVNSVSDALSEAEYKVTIGGIEYPLIRIGKTLYMASDFMNPVGTEGSDYKTLTITPAESESIDHNVTTTFYRINNILTEDSSGNCEMSDAIKNVVPTGWRLIKPSELLNVMYNINLTYTGVVYYYSADKTPNYYIDDWWDSEYITSCENYNRNGYEDDARYNVVYFWDYISDGERCTYARAYDWSTPLSNDPSMIQLRLAFDLNPDGSIPEGSGIIKTNANGDIADYVYSTHTKLIASGSLARKNASDDLLSYSDTADSYSIIGINSTGIAMGGYSFAEGEHTAALASCAHAEGENTVASGTYSHSEGYYTYATGHSSHAGGYRTLASGEASFAHGYNGYGEYNNYSLFDASGKGSVAFGYIDGKSWIEALGNGSCAIGYVSQAWWSTEKYLAGISADDDGAFAVGYAKNQGWVEACDCGAIAMGYAEENGSIDSCGYGAFAAGYISGSGDIEPSWHGAFAMGAVYDGGEYIESYSEGSLAFGCAIDGGGIQADGCGAVVMGFADEASCNGNTRGYMCAYGEGAIALGRGVYGEGDGSLSLGNQTFTKGNGAASIGMLTSAVGVAAIAIGHGATASVAGQIALGKYNIADTTSALILGNGTASDARSNLLRVSATGDLYLAGDLYTGNGSTSLSTSLESKANLTVLADAFSSTSTYMAYQFVTKDSLLYRSNSPINVAGEWKASDWDKVTLNDVIPLLAQRINGNDGALTKYLMLVEEGDAVGITGMTTLDAKTEEELKAASVAMYGINIKSVTADNAGKFLAINSDGNDVELVPVDTELGTIAVSELTGAATLTIPELRKFYALGALPAGVTSLSVTVPAAKDGYLTETAFEFTVSDGGMTALQVNVGGTETKKSGDFSKFEVGKTYQVTVVNNCAAIGVFE